MDSGTLLPRTSRRVVKLEKPSPLKRNQSTVDIESAAPYIQSENGGNKGFHRSLSMNDAVTTKQHLENGSAKAENEFGRKASRHQLKLEKPAMRLNSSASADTKAIHGVNRKQLVSQLSQDSGLGDASFLLQDSARNSLTEQPADVFTIPLTTSRKPSQDEGMFEDSQAILGDPRSENSGEHKYQYDMKVWCSNKFGENEFCHGNRKNAVICDNNNNNENCSNSNNYIYHGKHENGNHSLEKSPDDFDPETTPTNKDNLAAWLSKSRTLCKQSSGTGFNPSADDAFLTYRDKRNDSNDLSSSTSASTCAVTDDEHSEHLNAWEVVDELADDMFSCKLSESMPKQVRRLTIPGYRDETYAYDYPDDLDEIDAELDFGRVDELPSSQESYDMGQLKEGKFKNSVLKSSSPVLIPDEKIVVVLRQPLAPTSSLDEIWAIEETMKGGLYTAKGRRAMFRNFKMCDVEETFPEIFRQYSAEQLLEIGSSPAAGLPPSDWSEICGVNNSTPWKGSGLLPTPTSWAQEGPYSSSHYQHFGASTALRVQQGFLTRPNPSLQELGASLESQEHFRASTSRWDQHQREVTTQAVRHGFGMPSKLLGKEQISVPLAKSEGSSLAKFTHDRQSTEEQNTSSICNSVQKLELAKEESLLSCDPVVTANLDEKCDVTVNGGSITSQFNQHRPLGRGRGRKKSASPGVKLFASATQEIVTNKIQYTRSVSDPGNGDFGTVAFSADRSVQNQGPNTKSEISQYSSDNSRRLRHFSESFSTGIGVKNYKIHHSYTDDDEPNEAPLNKDFVPRKCPW
ncbi:hypothetical protein MAR_025831 [Mya arenaria]|uniref:Uncharacterized protein n=1 Tax=Mya arenaria TaxID=6604 RepID=A0ABY7EWU7_MYAAR|nr:hypothetical protein MAR_025831 [Mya arenaria]